MERQVNNQNVDNKKTRSYNLISLRTVSLNKKIIYLSFLNVQYSDYIVLQLTESSVNSTALYI